MRLRAQVVVHIVYGVTGDLRVDLAANCKAEPEEKSSVMRSRR